MRSILILVCFLFVFSAADAQRKTKKDDGVEIIEFEDDSRKKTRKKKSSKKRKKKKKSTPISGLILKTNPVSSIQGWQFVEAEYPVNGLFSASLLTSLF